MRKLKEFFKNEIKTFLTLLIFFVVSTSYATYFVIERFVATSTYEFVSQVRSFGDAKYLSQAIYSGVCSPSRVRKCVVRIEDRQSGYRIAVPKQFMDTTDFPGFDHTTTIRLNHLSGDSYATILSAPTIGHIFKVLLFSLFLALPFIFIFMLFRSRNRRRQIALKLKLEQQQRLLDQKMVSLTHKVAHDIRSPLESLKMIKNEISEDVPYKDIFQLAISRVEDIANDLLQQRRRKDNNLEVVDIHASLEEFVQEKKLAHNGIEYELGNKAPAPCIKGNKRDFLRIISNLTDNAIQADADQIRYNIFEKGEELVLRVVDNGNGIPDQVLDKLGKEEVTYGKKQGNGLGVFSASTTLKEWAGSISFDNLPKGGAVIELTFPNALTISTKS